jgi:CubicO group peptidase (beta-lactamase class C family)
MNIDIIKNGPKIFAFIILLVCGYLLYHSFHRISFENFIHLSPVFNKNHTSKETNQIPSVDSYLKSIHFNGTALIVKNNHLVLNKGYGYANIEEKVYNNSETDFYIGSVSKIFVATAIMQLQEKKKLDVHEPLSKYIPSFPNGDKITLYYLLTHTSGIPKHSETNEKLTHAQLIKKLETGSLKFKPGTNWFYNDANYSILAYIVEKVSHQSYQSYVEKHILQISKMTHSGFGDAFYHMSYPSKGYKIKHSLIFSPFMPDLSQLLGSGDVFATPYDMYLFDRNLYFGKLFPRTHLKQFFTPFKHHYAFGVYNYPDFYLDHGVLSGFETTNSFSKDGKTFVILFSNIQNENYNLKSINAHIYRLLKSKSH